MEDGSTHFADNRSALVDDKIMPPFRFGVVNEGVYRGAYPTLRNFRHLSRLRLTTVISIVPEPPSEDLQAFCKIADIKIHHFPVQRMAVCNAALMAQLVAAVNICINYAEHSRVYIHCLDGRRITGLFVMILRRLQGWLPYAAFAEYWKYQSVQKGAILAADVERVTREISKFMLESSETIVVQEKLPKWLWGGVAGRSKLTPGFKYKHSQTLSTDDQKGGENMLPKNYHKEFTGHLAGQLNGSALSGVSLPALNSLEGISQAPFSTQLPIQQLDDDVSSRNGLNSRRFGVGPESVRGRKWASAAGDVSMSQSLSKSLMEQQQSQMQQIQQQRQHALSESFARKQRHRMTYGGQPSDMMGIGMGIDLDIGENDSDSGSDGEDDMRDNLQLRSQKLRDLNLSLKDMRMNDFNGTLTPSTSAYSFSRNVKGNGLSSNSEVGKSEVIDGGDGASERSRNSSSGSVSKSRSGAEQMPNLNGRYLEALNLHGLDMPVMAAAGGANAISMSSVPNPVQFQLAPSSQGVSKPGAPSRGSSGYSNTNGSVSRIHSGSGSVFVATAGSSISAAGRANDKRIDQGNSGNFFTSVESQMDRHGEIDRDTSLSEKALNRVVSEQDASAFSQLMDSHDTTAEAPPTPIANIDLLTEQTSQYKRGDSIAET